MVALSRPVDDQLLGVRLRSHGRLQACQRRLLGHVVRCVGLSQGEGVDHRQVRNAQGHGLWVATNCRQARWYSAGVMIQHAVLHADACQAGQVAEPAVHQRPPVGPDRREEKRHSERRGDCRGNRPFSQHARSPGRNIECGQSARHAAVLELVAKVVLVDAALQALLHAVHAEDAPGLCPGPGKLEQLRGRESTKGLQHLLHRYASRPHASDDCTTTAACHSAGHGAGLQ
mmetsp:Transcript_75738/g.195175  ORF Transcript_75738/g.195175 Transcript_75738/m.195175 type:complete len:230 (+) Transcript_75738:134-823(+)